jgi:hypothetical protein
MGIRYYAYAFEAAHSEHALAAPEVFVSRDPLGDAWGLPHGWFTGDMQGQLLSKRVMLYLDKAWNLLQRATRPTFVTDPARPAYRMFEGSPHFNSDGSHRPWVRAIAPAEVVEIARDVESITDADLETALTDERSAYPASADEVAYATEYLHDAQEFARAIAADGDGFVYTIG